VNLDNLVYYEELHVFKKFSLPSIKFTRKRNELNVKISVGLPLLNLDIAYGVYGTSLALRFLIDYEALENPVKAKELEIKSIVNIVKNSTERLISELGFFAKNVLISPSFYVYEVCSMHKALFDILDPLVLALTMKIGKYRKVIEEKIVQYSGILEKYNIVQFIPKLFMFVPMEDLLRKAVSKDKLRFLKSYMYDAMLPYMNYLLKTRQALSSLTLGSINIVREKIAYPNPYSEVYFKVDDKLVKLHETLRNVKVIKDLGGIVNYTVLAKLKGNGEKLVVMKKYRNWKAIKWLPTALWTIGSIDFTPIPGERLLRETRALIILAKYGFKVPSIYSIDWVNKVLVREYIEGIPLSDIIRKKKKKLSEIAYRAGALLASIHSKGITLGDSRPSNIILSNGHLVPVDLEQSSNTIPPAWDIAEFLSFMSMDLLFRIKESLNAAKSFAEGYLSISNNRKVFYDSFKAKYVRILLPISPIFPLIASYVKDIIEETA